MLIRWPGATRTVNGMSTPLHPRTTPAYFAQASISFGVSLAATTLGILYLPLGGWPRAFLGIAMLYTVTSAFTLAKCVRDRQEDSVSRADQARLDKLLAEQDVLRVNVP